MDAMRQANHVDAVRYFERARESRPQSASAYANLGMAYWKLGAHDLAIEALTTAGDLDVNDPRPQLLVADVLQEVKRWDDARDVLTEVMNGLPERADMITRLARLEYRAGKVEQASAHLEHALQIDAKYAPALYNMAVMARDKRQDTLAAMRYFSRYLSVATDQVRIDNVHEQLALLRQPFRPAPAPPTAPLSASAAAGIERAADPVISLPTAVTTRTSAPPPSTTVAKPVAEISGDALLAQARQAIGDKAYDEALVLLGQARARDPKNADVLWTWATLYDQSLGQPQKAEVMLRDFVRLFPEDNRSVAARRRLERGPPPPSTAPTATTSRSTAATTTTTQPPVAMASSVRLTPSEAWQKGLDAHAANDWDEAIQYYETVLVADPTFASAAFNLGVAHKSRGNLAAARAAFKQAGAIDPDMAKAHYMVAVVAREQGERGPAIDAAKRALASDPSDQTTHYLLGLLYRESMRYDLARYHFKRAADLAPDRAAQEKARAALNSMPPAGARR